MNVSYFMSIFPAVSFSLDGPFSRQTNSAITGAMLLAWLRRHSQWDTSYSDTYWNEFHFMISWVNNFAATCPQKYLWFFPSSCARSHDNYKVRNFPHVNNVTGFLFFNTPIPSSVSISFKGTFFKIQMRFCKAAVGLHKCLFFLIIIIF